MATKIRRLIKIWLLISFMAARTEILTSWAALLFVVGKVLRFLLFFVFLFTILSSAKKLGGYSREQVILFFLIFNLVDVITQFLFRGVYQFRFLVVNGNFDLDLLKPLPSFFRPLFGWTDILDFITLFPLLAYFIFFGSSNGFFSSFSSIAFFLVLFLNSMLVSFSFHLTICSVCILTTEIDHLIWIYRDFSNMARFPTDIYQKNIRYFLTFIIPIVIMFSLPTKALLGLLSLKGVLLFSVFGMFLTLLSFKFWRYALSQYSSASS